MKDRTIDHSRPDAGEADKDIKSKLPKTEAAYEAQEEKVPEFKTQWVDVVDEVKAAAARGSAVGRTLACFVGLGPR